MAATARSASDDVLREALQEIREMNKVNAQVDCTNNCRLCFRADCKCEKTLSQLYTCVNGHAHPLEERPAGFKLGSATIKQPCPLYKQKGSIGDPEPGEDDLVVYPGSTSINEKPAGEPKWKQTRQRKVRKLWICIFATIIFGLLITLVVFTVLIKRDEYANAGPSILTPPIVAPGVVPANGQSVYKLDDGSLMICGHSQGQYACQVVDLDP